MQYMGIDPGKNGGIAIVDSDDPTESRGWKMPETERDLLDLLSEHETVRFCLIERVSSSPQMGVTSAFTFGRGYGLLRGILVALRISFDEVSPVIWQRNIGCLTKGDKNVSKAKAQQLFPHLKIGHAISDALLIAEFCRRREERAGVT